MCKQSCINLNSVGFVTKYYKPIENKVIRKGGSNVSLFNLSVPTQEFMDLAVVVPGDCSCTANCGCGDGSGRGQGTPTVPTV